LPREGDALTSCGSCGGQPDRFGARIAAGQAGPRAAESLSRRAEAAFAEREDPFSYAVVALEHAEAGAGEPELEALLAQAHGNFDRLGAMPWLRRARAVQRAGAAA